MILLSCPANGWWDRSPNGSNSNNLEVYKRQACMRTVPVPGRKGQFTQDFDANAYLAKVAVRCTVFPNLNDAELQQSYGVMGAEQLITTMPVSYTHLSAIESGRTSRRSSTASTRSLLR